jgi:hypothetical protein
MAVPIASCPSLSPIQLFQGPFNTVLVVNMLLPYVCIQITPLAHLISQTLGLPCSYRRPSPDGDAALLTQRSAWVCTVYPHTAFQSTMQVRQAKTWGSRLCLDDLPPLLPKSSLDLGVKRPVRLHSGASGDGELSPAWPSRS